MTLKLPSPQRSTHNTMFLESSDGSNWNFGMFPSTSCIENTERTTQSRVWSPPSVWNPNICFLTFFSCSFYFQEHKGVCHG